MDMQKRLLIDHRLLILWKYYYTIVVGLYFRIYTYIYIHIYDV